jgi:hypothetical protein
MPSTTSSSVSAVSFLDGDNALVADLLHDLGRITADFGIGDGRNRPDPSDFVILDYFSSVSFQLLDHRVDGLLDATLEVHRVYARRNCLGAFPHDRLSEDGSGRGTVAGTLERAMFSVRAVYVLSSLEGFAFLTEAILLGLHLYGWNRVSPALQCLPELRLW